MDKEDSKHNSKKKRSSGELYLKRFSNYYENENFLESSSSENGEYERDNINKLEMVNVNLIQDDSYESDHIETYSKNNRDNSNSINK